MDSKADWAEAYIRSGWSLVAIPAGSKAPKERGWQQPEKAINTVEDARRYYEANPAHNMGLLHIASGTVAFDVDSVANTKTIFQELGLDYEAIMAKAPRIIGRQDRGKALFRAPHDRLLTKKISWPREGDPRHSDVVFELRAGAVQDVLPPSIHPDTGNPYTWAGPSPMDGLPDLPHQLLALWEDWDNFRDQIMSICPWKPAQRYCPPSKPRPQGDRTSVIDAFNAAHDMRELLVRFGYKATGRNRFLSPNSTSGLAGVNLFEDGKAYSHHASDPFDSGHTFDAFDLWCQYEHMGDVTKAVKDAAKFLNVTTEPDHAYDAEAIEHGRMVADTIMASRKPKKESGPLDDIPEHLLAVPGILQDAVNFYSTTAPKDQPQFAVQTALAFGSIAMGRHWVTDQKNMTGLYFVNVGKSAAGKEHAKTSIERLMEAAGLEKLIGPSGYTSAAGVFSALLTQPAHISIIDELGRVLQSSQASGMQHKADAQTIMMEVFGRQTSTLRPQGYSKMGLNKNQSDELDKVVRSPSLTLLAMTTPGTLYDNLSSRLVSDGFLGRFLIVESHIGRQLSKPIKSSEPSDRLCDWAKTCAEAVDGNLGGGNEDLAPSPVMIPFAPACWPLLTACEQDMLDEMNSHERMGLDAMFGRTKEIAQRIALIVARSKEEEAISPESLQWAIDYATFYARRAVLALMRHMSDGPFEAACKAVYGLIERSGLKGMTEREIARACRPYGNLEPRRRRDVMEALAADKGVMLRTEVGPSGGRPRMAWIAPGDE